MLYERVKQLQRKGVSAAEIHRTLLSEGASEQDIKVILGSVGLGPQNVDPTQQLALAGRVLQSRPLRIAVYGLGAAAVGALLYVLYIVAVVARAFVEGLSQGR